MANFVQHTRWWGHVNPLPLVPDFGMQGKTSPLVSPQPPANLLSSTPYPLPASVGRPHNTHAAHLVSTTSLGFTMLMWPRPRCAPIFTSRMIVGLMAAGMGRFISFTASCSPVRLSRHSQVSPADPDPRRCCTSNTCDRPPGSGSRVQVCPCQAGWMELGTTVSVLSLAGDGTGDAGALFEVCDCNLPVAVAAAAARRCAVAQQHHPAQPGNCCCTLLAHGNQQKPSCQCPTPCACSRGYCCCRLLLVAPCCWSKLVAATASTPSSAAVSHPAPAAATVFCPSRLVLPGNNAAPGGGAAAATTASAPACCV